MKHLSVAFDDVESLRNAFISFVKDGGVFVKTEGDFALGEEVQVELSLPDSLEAEPINSKVVWITPLNNQQNTPAGVGLAFVDDKTKMRQQIERSLSNRLGSVEPTHTM